MQYLKSGPVQDPVIYTQSEVDGLLAAGLATKQNTLVSGTDIKTVGGNQLLGSGDLSIDARVFVSGETVAVGDVRYSPVDMLTYRAKNAGAHTTDPSADATNWARISGNLVGADLKTINGVSVIGAGDLVIGAPPGFVGFFAMNAPPAGYLKANGAAISRTTYAALFAAIGTVFGAGDGSTTFALPDLRGYFPRGWDNGRGVDSGRAFGSAQADANLSHNHAGTVDSAGEHIHSYGRATGSNAGGIYSQPGDYYTGTLPTSSAGSHAHTFTTAANGGTESRPKNIALLACIKF